MKFTCSTKPLIDSLNLGIVNQNITKFYKKSCLVQLTADRRNLTINVEVNSIVSEINLKGSGDEDTVVSILVDSLTLKQLVSTFEAAVTTLEFSDTGLILHSGKSKFNLPKMVEEDLDLKKPNRNLEFGAEMIDIDKSDWKFIKDHQMYAISLSTIHPVYRRVWLGEGSDVIVGDFEKSLFTHSDKNQLGTTCLLSDTIVNLFNSLPDGAKLTKIGKSYLIMVDTDGFSFAAQFMPDYEEDEGIGSYHAEIIIEMMGKDEENEIQLNVEDLRKVLSQADLLSSNTEATILFAFNQGEVTLKDSNVDCKIPVVSCKTSENPENCEIKFKVDLLKSVVSSFDSSTIYLAPAKQDDQIVGMTFWSDNVTVILAGAED